MSKKFNSSLGKSLMNAHKKAKKGHVITKDGFIHSSDLPDGLDWARLNLRSITEQTTVDDFLDKVKLADHEYSQEFENVKILSNSEASGVLSYEDKKLIAAAQEKHKAVVCIPRRPSWNISTSKEELDAREREEFLDWRRKLALLREEKHIQLTPYEKNLEIWRQLWRVIEKSDVVVQIVDARNPLLFHCEDLGFYVKEVDKRKRNILLLNKADFLSEKQRSFWADYFEQIKIEVVFFSALEQNEKTSNGKMSAKENDSDGESEEDSESAKDDDNDVEEHPQSEEPKSVSSQLKEKLKDELASNFKEVKEKSTEEKPESMPSEMEKQLRDSMQIKDSLKSERGKDMITNSSKLHSSEELIHFFKQFERIGDHQTGYTTIGLVGYPNVGKSSTINAVLSSKKVQVSATPGKTKHFQTIMVDSELCLCDCPGLVFPSFALSKADMVINGILPIDQLTDAFAPVSLVCSLIPRTTLEITYSILLPRSEGSLPSQPPTADEFLSAYGYMRGFMTQRGLPDTSRSARYILKDFINGKLLYCHPPPGTEDEEYQKYSMKPMLDVASITGKIKTSKPRKTISKSEEIDRNFFKNTTSQMHTKGLIPITGYGYNCNNPSSAEEKKSWKKHNNRNKKEKLRRIYPNSSYQ